jgi:hypothetical protein
MQNLDFNLKKSAYYLFANGFLMIATLSIILTLPLAGFIQFLLTVSVGYVFWVQLMVNGLLVSSKAIVALSFREQLGWQATTRAASFPAYFQGTSYVSRWLIILYIRNALTGEKHLAIVLPDSLEKHAFRHLRMALAVYPCPIN